MDLLDQLTQDYLAQKQLSEAGSVMAKDYTPHPLGNVGAAAHDLLNALNPIDWMGGPAAKAVIAPTNNAQLKGLYALAREHAPALMRKAERVPRTLYGYMRPGQHFEVGSKKAVGSFTNLDDTMKQGQMNLAAEQSPFQSLSTLLHELQHFLSAPKVYGRTKVNERGFSATAPKNARHALETAEQIGALLPKPQANMVGRYTQAARSPEQTMFEIEQTMKDANLVNDPDWAQLLSNNAHQWQANSLTAYDEARSYLAEALLGRQLGTPGGDPMLEPIARALGIRLK